MTQQETVKKQVFTTYSNAVNWLKNNYILCNNIAEIDSSIYDNMRFNFYDEETETGIFQWFLTDASDDDVEWLEDNFGLLFTKSNMLDCYVLCVTFWGVSWDQVPCEVLTDDMQEIIKRRKMTYNDLTKGK